MGNGVYAYLGYGIVLDYEKLEDLPWDSFGEVEEGEEPRPTFDEWTYMVSPLGSRYDFSLPNWSYMEWYKRPGNTLGDEEFRKLKLAMESASPIQETILDFNDHQAMLTIQGTRTQASWGEPTTPVMSVSAERIRAAKDFCHQHSIPFENPQWILIARADY